MADLSNWAFPPEMQPNAEELRFDLEAALDSMVLLRSEVPEDAFTAGILGTERIGNGVVIRDDGLVLTIGYLITEATTIRSEEHTSELQSHHDLVCRLLLEKKKNTTKTIITITRNNKRNIMKIPNNDN